MDTMRKISDKAFNQFQEKLKELKDVSILYKKQKEEIYDLYRQTNRLKNHIITMDELGQLVAVFVLSVHGITLIDKLLE